MDTRLEFVIPGIMQPMLVLHKPVATPNVGDITLGPDGTIYRIAQRAFLIEQSSSIIATGKPLKGCLVIQCVLVALAIEEPLKDEEATDAN